MGFLKNLFVGAVLAGVALLVDSCRIVSLSGGGSHGAFEAGVLSNIIHGDPTWKPWDVHLGVSAGSLGVLGLIKDDYKTNMDVLHDTWSETKSKDILEPFASKNSLYGNDKIKKLLTNSYSRLTGRSQVGGIFVVGVTNLVTGSFTPLEIDPSEPNLDYFLASTSIPVAFPPLAISDKEVFADGGLQKNEFFLSSLKYCPPDSSAYEMDLIFANYEVEQNDQGPWTLLEITKRSIDIIKEDFNNMYYKSVLSCSSSSSSAVKNDKSIGLTVNIFIPPSAISVSTLDFDHGEELWELGFYNVTKSTIYC